MPTAYQEFRKRMLPGAKPWQYYNSSNLPQLTESGMLQNKAVQVSDLASTLPSGDWSDMWRRANSLQAQSIFGQRERDVDRSLARMGLGFSAPGWRQSMLNMPYQQLYQNILSGEAQIGRAKMEEALELERLRLWRDQMEMANKPDWLGLGANLLTSLPFGLGALGFQPFSKG